MNIIVVFPKKEVALKIKNILVKNGYDVAAVCLNGAQAIAAAGHLETGVVVCSIRFVDMMYHELKECLPVYFEMIVVARREQWQEYGEEDAAWLPLPMKGFDLVDLVADLQAEILRRIKKDRTKPKTRSTEERKLIDRAKELLMARHGYTEEEAHRYLQKQSMDSGRALTATAKRVLAACEDGKADGSHTVSQE